jgi:ubiquinone/menaquinone biosynthesis C-methylase UbiE
MVSAESTARKYAGKMAANYEAKRMKQERWHLENAAIEDFLQRHQFKSVLDVPVGAGRFLALYQKLGLHCYGYDTSEEMLALAKRKRIPATLEVGDIREIPHKSNSMDASVCVRFMDLVPEDTMQKALHELARVTRHCIILTIRLGEKYIAKSNTATHDQKKFTSLCSKLGWHLLDEIPIFNQGWYVLLLGRKHEGGQVRRLERSTTRRTKAEGNVSRTRNSARK